MVFLVSEFTIEMLFALKRFGRFDLEVFSKTEIRLVSQYFPTQIGI